MTNIPQIWLETTLDALLKLWEGVIGFIPQLIGALLVFIIGWFVSVWIGKFIAEVLRRLRVDQIFEKTRWERALEEAEIKTKVSSFIGGLVQWILIIVFLSATIRILELEEFARFLDKIIDWLPNLIVAAAIFVAAVIISNLAEKFIKAIVSRMEVGYAKLLGTIVKWAVWIFAILIILSQLGIAESVVYTLITGFIALIVISAGIAFGLGGKDVAKEILEGLKNKIKERE